MRKLTAFVLAVMLLVPLGARGEEAPAVTANVTANAVAESENVYRVTAPYSGVLLPFDLESGDTVAAGDTLFSMDTLKVYAPEDGVLRAVFAGIGPDFLFIGVEDPAAHRRARRPKCREA